MIDKNLKIRLKVLAETLSLCAVLLLLIAPVVWANAEEAAAEHHGTDWKEWLWKIINFAILVVILVKFLGKPMREYFKKRTEVIEQSLNEAREAKELAQKALEEVREKIKLKDEEIDRIIEAARASGVADRDELIKKGEEMSEKIKEQAKSNIEMELKNAKAKLRAEAAELAVKLAEKKLKEKLTEEEQLRLLEESIKKLEE
ncbi:MAG: ATP synthase F0 subunit B [Nitrospirae bacterium]|nr:MAG: ATP synthase F0 subunit B [Nitrospirota bacterium]